MILDIGNWSYKHLAPIERQNPIDTQTRAFERLSAPSANDQIIVLCSTLPTNPAGLCAARAHPLIVCLREAISPPGPLDQFARAIDSISIN